MKFEEVPFDEKLPDGNPRYRLLKSGAVLDTTKKRGKIVARRITSEEGRKMADKRWDKWRDAAASAILKEVQAIDPSIKTEQEAWGFLVAKQYVTFLDAERPRGDDLVKMGQVVGAMPTAADKSSEPQEATSNRLEVALVAFINAMQDKIDENLVIEAEVEED